MLTRGEFFDWDYGMRYDVTVMTHEAEADLINRYKTSYNLTDNGLYRLISNGFQIFWKYRKLGMKMDEIVALRRSKWFQNFKLATK